MVKAGREFGGGVLVALVLGLMATPAWALVQATLDRNPVAEGESFVLILESDGAGGTPDLSPLEKDFEVLDQSQSSSFEIVNGAMSRKLQWRVTMMPRSVGHLQIPAIAMGGERTAPIALSVTAAGQGASGQARAADVQLEASVEPREVYVQQQAVITVRLLRRVDLANGASLTEPAVPAGSAHLQKLGEDRSYETRHNGVRYAVVERDYAVYPQKSGTLEIPPVVFDGDVVQGGGFFGADPFGSSGRHVRLRSSALNLQVKPKPASYADSRWLPARRVTLAEGWSPDPPTFKVGQPVTRTLTLRAEGLTAAQLPVIAAEVPGLKQYADQPNLEEEKDSGGITGTRVEKMALIPTRPGSLTLPALEIPWWNTATQRVEVARLPARTFQVEGAPGVTAPAVTALQAPASASPDAAATARTPMAPQGPWPDLPWFWVAVATTLGWLATASAWLWKARRPRSWVAPRPSAATPRSAARTIKARARCHDAAGTQVALLRWAALEWPDAPPLSLTQLARRCPPELAAELAALDRARYRDRCEEWRGDRLVASFEAWRPDDSEREAGSPGDLEPLYPR